MNITEQEIREFNKSQLEWYKKEIEWDNEEIERISRRIKDRKNEIKEFREFVWNTGVIQKWELELYGKINEPINIYKDKKLYKMTLERNKKYTDRKYHNAMVARYTELVNA